MSQNVCFHCGEIALEGNRWCLEIDGEEHIMCCPACKAVAETIIGSGLKDYYRHRTALPEISPQQKRSARNEVRDELKLYDEVAIQQPFVIRTTNAQQQVEAEAILVISGISCAACAWLIEHRLGQLKHVVSAKLNLTTHRLLLTWRDGDIKLSQILEEIHQLGYQAHPFSATEAEQQRVQESKTAFRRLAVAGFATMQVMMLAVPLYVGALQGILAQYEIFLRAASMLFATVVVLYSARPFFSAALRDIRTRHLTMDVPVSIAILMAYFASVWSTVNQGPEIYFDSVCMFTFFLLTGRFFEMRARHRMTQAGNNLLDLMPSAATKSCPEGDIVIPTSDIQVGDLLVIKPGQKIPADGIVESGTSAVDEAALTGEYLPIDKAQGDTLIGGTHNVESQLLMRVTATGADAELNTIMRLMDRAQHEKPAIAIFADKVASRFVAAVLIIASGIAITWSFIDPSQAFWITLAVLVVTCPCALSLATPTALTAATASLREQGFLISKGHVLEGLNQIDRIVFDKTGTLTRGELSLEQSLPAAENIDLTPKQALKIAATLEQYSNHPIARAFNSIVYFDTDNIEQVTAKGVQGRLINIDGHEDTVYRIGRADFAFPAVTLQPPIHDDRQWLLLADEKQPLYWFALSDTLRQGAIPMVKQLKDWGIKVSILTGDPSSQVEAVATTLNIDDVHKGLSPAQKLEFASRWQQQGERLMMVGDGINDVPTLARADIAVAIGQASDLTKTNADAVITNNSLTTILHALSKGKKSTRIIRQNIYWALLYNVLALPLAATGFIPPWAAAIGMSVSSLIVVGNALRLLSPNKQT
ncbi:MAG: cadmium-translocating P-type ATPase [Oleispira antarctica]|uniref:Probable cation-transporting P-type ATPase n=1 Tax=Oleispira antarctica RB-8 TaxID=698738 RepID=R4YM80_OLEAN|nr:cadmium-translocating P-type ATPase [Oleispira antarctica]MBQ0793633.1 cadmium-translocating P-type ATPase [Oleispira antarctica]CCK75820.1 Probable cation-transporting P-type ATPase [Oleispira antarctica RB-8]